MAFHNYIPDQNNFKLSGPPQWWLRKLYEFDNSLVVMPSRQGFYYRLAQRRRPNLTAAIVNEALFNESDTKMLASYNLIPVTTILSTAKWDNPYLFIELHNRMPSRLGGEEKVNKMLDEREREEEEKKQRETNQHLTDVAKSGWKYYQRLTGQRTHIDSTKRDKRLPSQIILAS